MLVNIIETSWGNLPRESRYARREGLRIIYGESRWNPELVVIAFYRVGAK